MTFKKPPYIILIAVFHAAFGLFFISNCRVLRGISDPAVRLYKRGSCISVDVPPITLTPSQTSIERQLIGDDVTLEENGWLVASAKSSRGSISKKENAEEARILYREIGILEYLEEDMLKYKRSGIIGESYDGNLYVLPGHLLPGNGSGIDADEIRRASRIAEEINRSRKKIIQYHLSKESVKDKGHVNIINERYKYIFYNQVKSGEWKQPDTGKWEKVK